LPSPRFFSCVPKEKKLHGLIHAFQIGGSYLPFVGGNFAESDAGGFGVEEMLAGNFGVRLDAGRDVHGITHRGVTAALVGADGTNDSWFGVDANADFDRGKFVTARSLSELGQVLQWIQ